MSELTLQQVINNSSIFTTKQQNTFMNQLKKNGRLQSKTKERIKNEYLRFYQVVSWVGKGRELGMEIDDERNVTQKKINGHTKERTKLGALLIILYSYLRYLKYEEDLMIKMNRAKWMQLTGIKTTMNDSFNYKERYSQLLYYVITNQIGAENKEIINYATGNYETAREAFDRGIWNSIMGFLGSSYQVEPQAITLYNFNEDAILNKYAEGLEKFLNKKQRKLKSKNIIQRMIMNWKQYNGYLDIPEEKPKNVVDLILRSKRIKRCINQTVEFHNTKIGLERIQFDYSKLKVRDYEKYNISDGSEVFEQNFNRKFKGIEATEAEREQIDFELGIYMEQNDFKPAMLFYAPYSEKSLGYKTIEKKSLEGLGFEKRYSLFFIDYNVMEKFIEKPIFIYKDLTKELSNDENTIKCMLTGIQGLIRPLIAADWEEKLKNYSKNNKSLPGTVKQKMVHPVINDVLYIIMKMTDNFYESQYLPENRLMKYRLNSTEKEKYIREIDVVDEEIKSVLDGYRGNNPPIQFELSEEESYLQQVQIEHCYKIIKTLIAKHLVC